MLAWSQVQGVLRHILTFGGGFLVAKGWIPEGMVEEVVGAVMTLLGLVWSIKAPEKKDV